MPPMASGPVAVRPAATLACPLVSVLDHWLTETVQPAGKISQHDPDLLQVCDDPAEVVRIITAAHSLAWPEQSFTEMT